MAPLFALPEDVVEFVNKVLGRCNTRIASRLSRLPTIHEQQTFGRPQLTGHGTMPQATVTCEKLSAARTVMVGIGLAGGLRHLSAMRFLTVGRVMSPDLSLTSTLDCSSLSQRGAPDFGSSANRHQCSRRCRTRRRGAIAGSTVPSEGVADSSTKGLPISRSGPRREPASRM